MPGGFFRPKSAEGKPEQSPAPAADRVNSDLGADCRELEFRVRRQSSGASSGISAKVKACELSRACASAKAASAASWVWNRSTTLPVQ